MELEMELEMAPAGPTSSGLPPRAPPTSRLNFDFKLTEGEMHHYSGSSEQVRSRSRPSQCMSSWFIVLISCSLHFSLAVQIRSLNYGRVTCL